MEIVHCPDVARRQPLGFRLGHDLIEQAACLSDLAVDGEVQDGSELGAVQHGLQGVLVYEYNRDVDAMGAGGLNVVEAGLVWIDVSEIHLGAEVVVLATLFAVVANCTHPFWVVVEVQSLGF